LGPAALAQVLRPLTLATHPDLVVGLQTSDDAAVYRIAPDLAVVQTVDFFTPIVDDPWTYGAIAAANSMSDVYAMGGTVLFALNVAGFPEDLPPRMITAIFQGAAEKVAEAGAIIAGGHTVTDAEPKFGLVVTGTIHPDRVWTKAGALPGDVLFLTKPIGTGIVATALKSQKARAEDVEAATASMLTLNRAAAETARAAGGVHAATDITGFGLLGHASEMADKSGVGLQINAWSVPLLPGTEAYAGAGLIAGGLGRNRDYFVQNGGGIRFDPNVEAVLQTILFDPQTSGGLLFAVDAGQADAFETAFTGDGIPLWRIGQVVDGAGIDVSP
jgi:selenide,water dikinase